MSDRRFTNKPALAPDDVRGLSQSHAAMIGNRTLFPTTVVTVTEDQPERLLISGRNNRKLGETVEKGAFKGYAIYGLSLEERATCPRDCAVRDICYGNGMQMARRHRIDPQNEDMFYDRLDAELGSLIKKHGNVLVRLHVLGDFPSIDYVAAWKDLLEQHQGLAIYGYTARKPTSAIGEAIESVKAAFPERFRIRWSNIAVPVDAAIVDGIGIEPVTAAIACPAQGDGTECCATCALCWEPAAANKTITFQKHGPKSLAVAAEAAMLAAERPRDTTDGVDDRVPLDDLKLEGSALVQSVDDVRAIVPIVLPPKMTPRKLTQDRPDIEMVRLADMRIEKAYQRDLSDKSIGLIRKIACGWDWSKFKLPICAKRADGTYLVIDGQNTSIGAATNGSIAALPVVVIQAETIEARAQSFVSHNTDRIAMSPLQVFHAGVAAGDPVEVALLRTIIEAGCRVPKTPPRKGFAQPGDVVSIDAARRLQKSHGAAALRRTLTLCRLGGLCPIASTAIRGVGTFVAEPYFGADAFADDVVVEAIEALAANFERTAQDFATETGQNRFRAVAVLIRDAMGGCL